MRTWFLIMAFFSFALVASGQNPGQDTNATDTISADTVMTEKALKTIQKKYPKASTDEWVMDKDVYTVTFYDDNKWYDVLIDTNGVWMGTYVLINYEDMPEAVRKSFEGTKYKDHEIFKIQQSEKKNDHFYKILVFNYKDEEVELKFKADGSRVH